MRTALFALIGLAGLATSASAEDFTGFYAGVNAGYAFETGGQDKRGFGPGAARYESRTAAGRALPPSAEGASRALQARNRASQGAGTLPH